MTAVDQIIPTAGTAPSGDFEISMTRVFLSALLDKAANVVPSKEIMPVLKNFQVEAEPGRLRIAASDLELSVVATTPMVQVIKPGRVFLPAKRMVDIAGSAVGEKISIVVSDGTATIVSGKATWRVKLDSGTDYPPLPDVTDVALYEFDRGQFLSGIKSVRYAAAKELTRANLAMIDVTHGRMTACDGTRFQQITLGEDFPFSLQIPVSAVDDLVKLLGKDSTLGNISVGESENHIVFRVGGDVFIANKLTVAYPDVEAQMLGPAQNNTDALHVDREELLAVIRRVRINADPESSAIVLSINGGEMSVASRDKTGNTCEEALDVGWESSPRTVVVNHRFLAEMLTMYDGKTCKLLLAEDKKAKSKKAPIMLRDETTGMIGLIQQMRSDFVLS